MAAMQVMQAMEVPAPIMVVVLVLWLVVGIALQEVMGEVVGLALQEEAMGEVVGLALQEAVGEVVDVALQEEAGEVLEDAKRDTYIKRRKN